MSSKPKGSRHEYSFKTILVSLELKKLGQLPCENAYHLEIFKSFVTTIFVPGS